jgi:hypothetical protein
MHNFQDLVNRFQLVIGDSDTQYVENTFKRYAMQLRQGKHDTGVLEDAIKQLDGLRYSLELCADEVLQDIGVGEVYGCVD